MRFQNITYPDVSNGTGCRVVLWLQGCSHHCEGCHNPETWDFLKGREFTDEYKEKLIEALNLPYIKGLTLSGGDPLDSYEEVYELLKEIREKCKGKDVWLYTGYRMDDIKGTDRSKVLSLVDVVVDGPFMQGLRDVTLAFRGSSNQIIWKKVNGDFVRSGLN